MPADLKFDLSAQSAAFLYEYQVGRRVADLINSATVEYNDDGSYTFSDTTSVAAIRADRWLSDLISANRP